MDDFETLKMTTSLSSSYGSLSHDASLPIAKCSNLSNINEEMFPVPPSSLRREWRIVVTVLALFMLLCLLVSLNNHSKDNSYFLKDVISFHNVFKSSKDVMRASEFSDEYFDHYFNFARKGYDVLPYFGDDRDDTIKYSILDDINVIIEPYAEMRIVLSSNTNYLVDIEYYKYEICFDGTKDSECYDGKYSVASPDDETMISVPCTPFDRLTVSVKGYDSAGNAVIASSGYALCMYVRREILSLSNKDLEKTMDAMHMLWEISDTEGVELYGERTEREMISYEVIFLYFV